MKQGKFVCTKCGSDEVYQNTKAFRALNSSHRQNLDDAEWCEGCDTYNWQGYPPYKSIVEWREAP